MAPEKEQKQTTKLGVLFVLSFFLYFFSPAIGRTIVIDITKGSYSEFINLTFGQVLPLILMFVSALFFILFLYHFSLSTIDLDLKQIRKQLIWTILVASIPIIGFIIIMTGVGDSLTPGTGSLVMQALIVFFLATAVAAGVISFCFVSKNREGTKK